MKIYNPVRRSKFVWRDLHTVTCKFETVGALRSALYHEFDADIPDGEYIGYFEGKQQRKKWLVSSLDLVAMYTYYQGKPRISLWCDGKEPSDNGLSSDEERPPKKAKKEENVAQSKLNEREELESIFQQLTKKHGSNYSGPQLRLWIVAKTHDDISEPPKVPMITGVVQKRQQKDSLSDAFAVNLGVDSATVSRTVTRFRETGGVEKKKHPSTRVYCKLTASLELVIL